MATTTQSDKYLSFEALCQEEPAHAFHIHCRPRPSPVGIVVPHGGKIERWTSPIGAQIAADDYNFYRFEGQKPCNNRDLHITSSRFNEPQGLALVTNCDWVVAVHGCTGEERVVYLGGLDNVLRDEIQCNLEAARFTTGVHENPDLQGIHPDNVCNRGRRGCGVQLEITYGLRSDLMTAERHQEAQTLAEFAMAIRRAIEANC